MTTHILKRYWQTPGSRMEENANGPWVRFEDVNRLLNTPELYRFAQGVVMEARHQRARYGSEHDAGKQPEDWLFLIGYLAGKATVAHREGNKDTALHHTISSAAVLANWHAAISGDNTSMRPGITGAKI